MPDNTSSRATLIAFSVVSVLIVVGLALILLSRPEPVTITINPPAPTLTPIPTATPEPILVYVTGAITQPETTQLVPFGSRVQDVLDAAGGVTADADLSRVNLAAIVHDGDQVHVPSTSADNEQVDTAPALPTASGGPVVYINTATVDDLQTLPRIGQVMAERIIAYREEHGPFTSIEQLGEVSGIGEGTLEQIAPYISLD